MTSLTQRRDRGAAVYARLIPKPHDALRPAMDAMVSAEFADEVLVDAGSIGWSSPDLTDRERDLVLLTALVAQRIGGHRLESHLAAARRDGITEEGLVATMTMIAHYCGYPTASSAMETVMHTRP